MSIIDIDPLTCLIGTEIDRVESGLGSFINIFSRSRKNEDIYQLWIYMSQWAITKSDIELIASDKSENIHIFNFGDIFHSGIYYERIISIDHEEIKIIFSDDLKLELWGDPKAYGIGSVMAHLYRNGSSIGSITLDDA